MKRDWRDWLSGGGYLALLLLGLETATAAAWAGSLAATLALALLAWQSAQRRLRAVADTPTSRIASAAQGYVELVGRALALPDAPLYSPNHHLPCLWYRYRAFVREQNKWRPSGSGESDAPFLLDDGSGRCLIDPAGAEILAPRRDTYTSGDRRVEEELLLAGDRLYVLGEFTSQGGGQTHADTRLELGRILAGWKDEPDTLRQRFDLDRDGRISEQEWRLARQAAQRDLAARRREALAQPVSHVLGRPGHGRPHLIAAFPPDTLTSRYRLRLRLHGLVAVASLLGLAVALQAL